MNVFQYTLAGSKLKLHISNEENECRKLENLKQKIEDNKRIIIERNKILKELSKKIHLNEKSLEDDKAELEQLKNVEFGVCQALKTLRLKLEESRSSLQASRSRGRVLDSLIQQKKEGNLPGFFGRLVSYIIFNLFNTIIKYQ